MIKHIVLFRFKEADPEQKKANAESLVRIFSPLGKLACVKNYYVGKNFSDSEFAYDVVIDSEFETIDDLDSYRMSEEHIKAVAKASAFKKEKSVIDYQY